jgi:hypothetical protein
MTARNKVCCNAEASQGSQCEANRKLSSKTWWLFIGWVELQDQSKQSHASQGQQHGDSMGFKGQVLSILDILSSFCAPFVPIDSPPPPSETMHHA